jgi:T-complex protein 1 subunit zeta
MSGLEMVNPNADQILGNQALMINIGAGKALGDIIKTNLGPRGTMKMYNTSR